MGHRPLGRERGFPTEDSEGLTERPGSVTLNAESECFIHLEPKFPETYLCGEEVGGIRHLPGTA
jgi:hypothetical protein